MSEVLKSVRSSVSWPITIMAAPLEADGQPPADAILPGPDGLIYHKPFDDAAANRQYEEDHRLALKVYYHMKYTPALQPTRYHRWVEPVRIRQARWLREAEQEVEAYLA